LIFDSNVVIELIERDGTGALAARLGRVRQERRLFTNAVVLAEVSSGFGELADVLEFFERMAATLVPFAPDEAFRAGQAFAEYRRRGGTRTAILPDFLIGAQAATRGWPLVTRDRKGLDRYFPELTIIDPLEDQA
jgi:predicted nucleic acid-binding protein